MEQIAIDFVITSVSSSSLHKTQQLRHHEKGLAKNNKQPTINRAGSTHHSSGSGGSCNNTSKKKNSRNFKNKFPDRHEQQQSTSINMQT
jgi:uncharacterized membrane protein